MQQPKERGESSVRKDREVTQAQWGKRKGAEHAEAPPAKKPKEVEKVKCFGCGKFGHRIKDCREAFKGNGWQKSS